MIPYLAILVFVPLVAYAGRQTKSTSVQWVSLAILMAVLILFAGLRNVSVGSDSDSYALMFEHATSFANAMAAPNEVGYKALNWVLRSVSDSYSVLFCVIALIVVSGYVSTIVRVLRRYETGLFLFITLGAYTFLFNGARQAMAMAICFWALPFLLERRLLPYLVAVGVAMLFHKTAIFAAPLYFLASPRVTVWRVLAAVGATAILIVFLRVVVSVASDVLSDRYAAYGIAGTGGAEVTLAFLLGQGGLLYALRRFIRDGADKYSRLLNIYIVGLIIAVAAVVSNVNPAGLIRLAMYCSSTAILMWPIFFAQFRDRRLQVIVGYAFVCVTVLAFVLRTSAVSELVPYTINPAFGL